MIIEKSIIAPKLTKLKSFILKSSTDPVQGVLFKDNCLTVTNFEIGIKTPLEAITDETFIITPRAIELIENLPDGAIEIIPDENYSITIKAARIKNKFQSYDPKMFPKLESQSPDTKAGKISSLNFDKAIKSVIYAVAGFTTKPIFGGILFDSSKGKLNLVGCDGYRLAWSKIDYENEFSFVVPKTSIQKLMSIGISGDIEVAYNDRNAIFKSEEYTVYTRLLEGTYLAYQNMFIKRDNKTTINRITLLEAIKRCTICADEKNKSIVKLQLEDEKLTISTNSETSEYIEEIKLEAPADEPLTIAFNGVYLIEFLKSFDCENIQFFFGSPVQPMIAENGEQSALVLPVKTN